jgi:hypothetical protein
MKLVVRIGIGCTLLATVLTSSAVALARPNAVCCKPEAGKRIVVTDLYRFTLLIGNVENMYMPRQVRANHSSTVKRCCAGP